MSEGTKPLSVFCMLALAVTHIACSRRSQEASVNASDFFLKPPTAERAFLGPYRSESLEGKSGIRIETAPLHFLDAELDQELEPEILLEYLSLPSIDPAKLQNTRYTQSSDPNSSYEGSFYFLGEHNWVDLKEIRFLNATGNTIQTEYDLIIHLPKSDPNKCAITLRAPTIVEIGEPKLEPPRTVVGLGTLVNFKENSWRGEALYDGHPVEIELSATAEEFDQIAAFARSVIAAESLPRSTMNHDIEKWLEFLADKFQRFRVTEEFKAEEFVPYRFYFYKRRHHPKPELIIGLRHPKDDGHWALNFNDIERGGHLNWVPKERP